MKWIAIGLALIIAVAIGAWWYEGYEAQAALLKQPIYRVLKKHDPSYLRKYDVGTLKHLFLAGEPLDEPTHQWLSEALGKPVIDHY